MKVLKIDTNSKCVGNASKDKNTGICVPVGLNKTHQETQISLKSKNKHKICSHYLEEKKSR